MSTGSTHECYRLEPSETDPSTLAHKNHDFEGGGGLVRTNAPITTSERNIEISSRLTGFECSDGLHTMSTGSSHEYYRLEPSETDPSTLAHKNPDFEVGVG